MTSRLEAATYLLALGNLKGVGSRSVVGIARAYPTRQALESATDAELTQHLSSRTLAALQTGLAADWPEALTKAERAITAHQDKSITLIPLADPAYPRLLGLIDDPPPVLYVRGDELAVASAKTVAVVGTRDATERGLAVARRVAARFADMGFVVISGLAKGIDTAAHQGALTTGRTIAVLGTPLDKIYPAENKQLAAQIADSGALVTEYPLGYASRGQSFVERDRIQSGMSLAVVPVQTARKGGTQHTIRFATDQRRLLFCPAPQSDEEDLPAYDGIWDLIRSGRARSFTADDYEELAQVMRDRADLLLLTPPPPPESSRPASKRGRTKRETTPPGPDALSLFDDVTVARELGANGDQGTNGANGPAAVDLEALVLQLAGQLQEAAPDLTVDGLDLILGEVRKRWTNRSP